MNKKTDNIVTHKLPGMIITTDGVSSIATVVSGPAFATLALQAKPIKEKAMCISTTDTNYGARSRLAERASDAHYEHTKSLRKHFYIDNHDTSEWSTANFIEAIKAGMYIPAGDDEKKFNKKGSFHPYNILSCIEFRDPSKKADHEGFEAAIKRLDEEHEKVYDHIVIDEPAKAMELVNKFREKTFH